MVPLRRFHAAALAVSVALAALPLPAAAAELTLGGDIVLGGRGYDQLAATTMSGDGSIVAVGSSFVSGDIYQKAWVVRVGPDGKVGWEMLFQEHFRSKARAVAVLPAGQVAIAGSYKTRADVETLGFVAKLDATTGEVAWSNAFGGDGEDDIFGIVGLEDGGAIVAGSTTVEGEAGPQGWIMRLDSSGNRAWEYTIGLGPAAGIARLADGAFAVVGRTNADRPDAWATVFDADGRFRWQRTYGGPEHDTGNAVAGTGDGGMILGGETFSKGAGGSDGWLLRLKPDGEPIWSRTYGRASTDRVNGVAVYGGGGIATVGSSQTPGTDDFNLWAQVVDAAGQPIAQTLLGGPRDDRGLGLTLRGDGALVIAGTTQPEDTSALIANGRIVILAPPKAPQ